MATISTEGFLPGGDYSRISRQEAVTLAKRWAVSYFEGTPEVSDAEFDALIEHIKKTWPDERLPYAVGFGYEVDGAKRPHKVPTGSLPKVKECDFVQRQEATRRVTPKYDGISVVLYFEEGRLTDALTRGGGEGTGKPILHNLYWTAKVQGLSEMEPSVMAISAEVVIYTQAFEAYLADDYELPRSAAAGIAQTRSCHRQRGLLRLEPFRIHFQDGRSLAITDDKDELEFKHYVPFARAHPVADPATLKAWADSLGVPTDGEVLSDAVALKFETESVESKVLKIRRQVSRLGRIIPVVEVEPRRLYGTTVQSVTMVSEGWLRTHGIGPGAVILLTKANEIIPQFLSTVQRVPYEEPRSCPRCGGPVKSVGDHLHCARNCVGEAYRPRHFIWTHASLLGFADSALDHIFEINGIRSMDDLMEKAGKLVGNGLTDRERVFLNHINKKLTEPLAMELLLASLNLPGVGETWSRKLAPCIEEWVLNKQSLPPSAINVNVHDAMIAHADIIEKVYTRFEWLASKGRGQQPHDPEGGSHGIPRQ